MPNYDHLLLQPNVRQPDWLRGLDHFVLGYEHPDRNKRVGVVVYANLITSENLGPNTQVLYPGSSRSLERALILWYIPIPSTQLMVPLIETEKGQWLMGQSNIGFKIQRLLFNDKIENLREAIRKYCADYGAPADAVAYTKTVSEDNKEDMEKFFLSSLQLAAFYMYRRSLESLAEWGVGHGVVDEGHAVLGTGIITEADVRGVREDLANFRGGDINKLLEGQ